MKARTTNRQHCNDRSRTNHPTAKPSYSEARVRFQATLRTRVVGLHTSDGRPLTKGFSALAPHHGSISIAALGMPMHHLVVPIGSPSWLGSRSPPHGHAPIVPDADTPHGLGYIDVDDLNRRVAAACGYASGLTHLLDGMMVCQGCDLKGGVKVRCKVDVKRTC